MFATTKKFVIIPAMIGFAAAVAAISPAMAETTESMEPMETAAANCLPLELEKTGTCIPLPSVSIRRTATTTSAVNSESESESLDTADMPTEPTMSQAESPMLDAEQPTALSSIEALNTPEALSQLPMLPAITGNIAQEVPEDAALFAQDINADGQDVALND
ncbi:hypothetical protein IQ266_06385 [filamentous cyanobacterium LEGE 11480]|uniref:Secreted protein n=1 Tax=Romeriopsis navalis LEGE 11480 TaxID=2777977 RepID=A0A928Z3K4_9CYAN|nr:hypothetical protein [Romeriopsis navalis]MBE9029390.1 hypothetical protein [Romeriopsis navalis LEGE 11480]